MARSNAQDGQCTQCAPADASVRVVLQIVPQLAWAEDGAGKQHALQVFIVLTPAPTDGLPAAREPGAETSHASGDHDAHLQPGSSLLSAVGLPWARILAHLPLQTLAPMRLACRWALLCDE